MGHLAGHENTGADSGLVKAHQQGWQVFTRTVLYSCIAVAAVVTLVVTLIVTLAPSAH